MAVPRFYSCSCFTTDNIFLEQYQLHVRYENAQQFAQDYRAMLVRLGCDTEQLYNDVLEKVLQEVTRRKLLDEAASERTAIIQKTYRPLHPQVYQLQDSHVDPGLRRMAEYCRGDGASLEGLLQMLEEEPGEGGGAKASI
ncbi:2-oxoglutarate and iron-dependent oxygenase domain-containing protein 2-like, partial [Menidia menidia]